MCHLAPVPGFRSIRSQLGAASADPTVISIANYPLVQLASSSSEDVAVYWTGRGTVPADTLTLELLILSATSDAYTVADSMVLAPATLGVFNTSGAAFTVRIASVSVSAATHIQLLAAALLASPVAGGSFPVDDDWVTNVARPSTIPSFGDRPGRRPPTVKPRPRPIRKPPSKDDFPWRDPSGLRWGVNSACSDPEFEPIMPPLLGGVRTPLWEVDPAEPIFVVNAHDCGSDVASGGALTNCNVSQGYARCGSTVLRQVGDTDIWEDTNTGQKYVLCKKGTPQAKDPEAFRAL